MESNQEPSDELHDLLLSAVRQGDIDSLEKHLSTVINPDIYINRVYDEEYTQKCTLLTIACLNGHVNIIHMLLHRYKPDLEVLNNIVFGDGDKSQQMCLNVTVLWTAVAIDNFEIVKFLVEHGANVNHTTKTNSTPLRSACYNGNVDIARYLIGNGADVHIAKENNDTNLAVSVYRKHLEMATYLVDELGCDVNVCDNDGRSPLYDAVNGGSLELVQFVLKHGARNFRAICDRMSPLMWAAEKRRTDLVDVISSRCSSLEQIEAEELLASAFVCGELENRDIEQAFEHFTRAFELRSIHNLPKTLKSTTLDIFDNRQECQTIDQFREFQSNPDNLYIEALLVRERLLGSTNAEYRYSVRYQGAILADNDHHHQAIALWLYEIRLRQEHSISMDSENLRHFASMFCEMLYIASYIPIEALLTVITVTTEELEHNSISFDFNLHTLLFLITITSQLLTNENISITDQRNIYQRFRSLINHRYVTRTDRSSLLHLCLNDNTSANEYFIDRTCQYPCLLTTRVLLYCGADINATDAIRNTPLHVFVSNFSICDEPIFELLYANGAHLDCVNTLGETAIDIASNLTIIQLLKTRTKLNLKCLCARLIQKNSVPFRGKITASLVSFVEKH